jgi:hypothetical protein
LLEKGFKEEVKGAQNVWVRIPKIGIYSIFVGPNYTQYYKSFVENMQKRFFTGSKLHFFIVTDDQSLQPYDNVTFQYVTPADAVWPLVTLNRFKYFLQFPISKVRTCDYIFFMNSNARCYANVLFDLSRDFTFTQHFWFVNKPYTALTLEKDASSTACVPYVPGKRYVYVGSRLYGAKTERFMEMSKLLAENTAADFANKHIAIWHDESHLNWFFNVHMQSSNFYLLNWTYHVDEPSIKGLVRRRVIPQMVYLHKKFKVPKTHNGDYTFEDANAQNIVDCRSSLDSICDFYRRPSAFFHRAFFHRAPCVSA